MPKVRIPNTSVRRNEFPFCTLIERIQPLVWHPMAIKGKHLRCGKEIDVEELWPAPNYPRVPLLLEFAGIAVAGWGHKRSSHRYILWQYDAEKTAFVELVRVDGYGVEWYDTIRSRALEALRDPERTSARKAAWAAKRVTAVVEIELQGLDFEGRGHFISRLYEEAAGRLAGFD